LRIENQGWRLTAQNEYGSDGARNPLASIIQLTEIESGFRCLKSELGIRPIWYRVSKRIEAHILVAFMGYCLWVCLPCITEPETEQALLLHQLDLKLPKQLPPRIYGGDV
jgi:hypothetical protein